MAGGGGARQRAQDTNVESPVAGNQRAAAVGHTDGALAGYADWWNPILADPLRVKDGMSDPAGVIGSGTEWNEAAVERFLV